MSNEPNNEQIDEQVTDKSTVGEPENKSEVKTVTMTQDELNELIGREKGRVKKRYADYDDITKELAELRAEREDRKKAEMSEIERLQHEKELAEQKAKEFEAKQSDAFAKANKRLIDAELKVALKEAGIRNDAMKTAIKVFDVSSVSVDEEGNVQGVVEALEAFKKDNAFMFGAVQHADPSPGNHEIKREDEKAKAVKQLAEAEAKAKRSGKNEDRVAFVQLKKKLGLF